MVLSDIFSAMASKRPTIQMVLSKKLNLIISVLINIIFFNKNSININNK